jgi:hypothetical protein
MAGEYNRWQLYSDDSPVFCKEIIEENSSETVSADEKQMKYKSSLDNRLDAVREILLDAFSKDDDKQGTALVIGLYVSEGKEEMNRIASRLILLLNELGERREEYYHQ